MAICVRVRTSACWWGPCAPCLASSRSTSPCRSSSTTLVCSTRTRRRAPSCPRFDDVWWLRPGTRRSIRPQTLLRAALIGTASRTNARDFAIPSRLFSFLCRCMWSCYGPDCANQLDSISLGIHTSLSNVLVSLGNRGCTELPWRP